MTLCSTLIKLLSPFHSIHLVLCSLQSSFSLFVSVLRLHGSCLPLLLTLHSAEAMGGDAAPAGEDQDKAGNQSTDTHQLKFERRFMPRRLYTTARRAFVELVMAVQRLCFVFFLMLCAGGGLVVWTQLIGGVCSTCFFLMFVWVMHGKQATVSPSRLAGLIANALAVGCLLFDVRRHIFLICHYDPHLWQYQVFASALTSHSFVLVCAQLLDLSLYSVLCVFGFCCSAV